MTIDMGFRGPLGNDVRIQDGVLYLHGSNHWLEWLHHFMPGAAWRERRWARQVVDLIRNTPGIHTIAGHSVGGTVACIAANIHGGLRLYTYGAKRPQQDVYRFYFSKHYAIKGDIVPHLPPWRKPLPLIVMDYGKMGIAEAHGPASYYPLMEQDGVR
jgi:pimeloyl-ACP methyl ester carboxylesterase